MLRVGRNQTLSLCQRIQNFEREMVARSSPKVLASYEASGLLHSPAILEESYTIEGADADLSLEILEELDAQGIDASRGEELETLLRETRDRLKADDGSIGVSSSN